MKHSSFLLILFMFITSCEGQVKTSQTLSGQKESLNEPGAIIEGQSKLITQQGNPYGNVGCGFRDKAGNLWFGTSSEGVFRYDGRSFTNFTKKDGLNSNSVNAIIEDKAGNILFGTNEGVCKYDGSVITNFAENDDVGKKCIWSLLEDREGNLWIGTMESGVYRYDGKSFTNFLNNDDHPFNLGRHNQAIKGILQDKAGNIWLCSWNRGGVWRYDGRSFTNYLPSADYYLPKDSAAGYDQFFTGYFPKNCLPDDMIFSISEDRAGNLWFATRRHGACCYDGKYFKVFRENEGFVSRGVYSVLEDKKGNIWLTTEDNGVWCYDGKSFKNFTTKDGLINNSVVSILEDRNGNLWFGTRKYGLSRYDGKTFMGFSQYGSGQ